MQAIPAIRAVASTLSLEPAAHDASAEGQFLAAVDRLQPAGGPTVCNVEFEDAVGDTGSIYVVQRPEGGPSQGDRLDAAPVRLSMRDGGTGPSDAEFVVHAYTPAEAEARGYELIAAAAVARLNAEG